MLALLATIHDEWGSIRVWAIQAPGFLRSEDFIDKLPEMERKLKELWEELQP